MVERNEANASRLPVTINIDGRVFTGWTRMRRLYAGGYDDGRDRDCPGVYVPITFHECKRHNPMMLVIPATTFAISWPEHKEAAESCLDDLAGWRATCGCRCERCKAEALAAGVTPERASAVKRRQLEYVAEEAAREGRETVRRIAAIEASEPHAPDCGRCGERMETIGAGSWLCRLCMLGTMQLEPIPAREEGDGDATR